MRRPIDKKTQLARDIKRCVVHYNALVENTYLIVYEGCCSEIMFKRKNFKHLTGAGSCLSADDFYKNAMNGRLTGNQLFFEKAHPYKTCKNKVKCLDTLDEFLKQETIIVENIYTDKGTFFKIGVTNLDFTICFSHDINRNNSLISNVLIPYSIRIKDDAFAISKNQYVVDYVFKKKNNEKMYSELVFGDANKINTLPNTASEMILLQP